MNTLQHSNTMEPDSSPPRDTPEQNPSPSRTGEPEHWDKGLRSMEIDRDLVERHMSQVRESASGVLELSLQWKEYDEEMRLKEESLREQVMELQKKEERLRMVEERERKIELLEDTIKERLGVLEEKEKEANLKRSDFEELVTQHKALDELLQDSMVKKHQELMRELEVRKLELEARENKLNETIKEKSTELEKKEEMFQLKQKAEAGEIEVKRKLLKLKEKVVEEREKVLERKQKELEEQPTQADTSKRSRHESEPPTQEETSKRSRHESEPPTQAETSKSFRHESEHPTQAATIRDSGMNLSLQHKQRLVRDPGMNLSLQGKGRDVDSQMHIGKKHKPMREHKRDGGEKETQVYEAVCADDEDHERYNCPDPDFNDFNKKMSSFAVDQVWALYDPLDQMPRYYAQIRRILKPQMSVEVTWLESVKNTADEKTIPVACGEFKYGESEIQSHLTLSHEMRYIKSGKNVTIINPRKGETWAVFKDWSKTWIRDREQHEPPYRYEFVEVVSELDSHKGIGVAYLERVEGYTSVYRLAEQHSGLIKSMISSDQMLRFSHRVPSFILTGDEKDGVPAGSFELDPAAIPRANLIAAKVKVEEKTSP